MLRRVENPLIKEENKTYELFNGIKIYCKTLQKESLDGRTAIFIHGGGSGGNHTIVKRPSYWMIDKGLFTRILLPDRRGAGLSSPITEIMTHEENAKDIKYLLDAMGINTKITAIGISYGGPIALNLAAMDSRIDRVVLIASSPSLKPTRGIAGFLYKHNILEPIVRQVYKKMIGRIEQYYCDYDEIYDAKNLSHLKKIFFDGIKGLPKERLESLLLENASTCSLDNQAISKDISVQVPVYRVIGTKDEVWEVKLEDKYKKQIPFITTTYVDNANHKDVFFRADEFYEKLYELMGT